MAVVTHEVYAVTGATGASTTYIPNKNAAPRHLADMLRKKMEIKKAVMRVRMSTVVTPANMRLMVARPEQAKASALAMMNASKT